VFGEDHDMIKVKTEDFNKREIGPHIFVKQLFKELDDRVKIITTGDADLIFTYTKNLDEYIQNHPKTPHVSRCGGVWDRKDWRDHMSIRYNQADGLIFQSEFCRREYNRVYGELRDVPNMIIHNGSNVKFVPTEERAYNAVVCNAQWRDTKRPELIQEVAKLIPHIDFNIIGDYLPEPLDNMHVIGQVPRADIHKYLRLGKVFLHTGKRDPCPNAVVEAICSGLIPIVSSVGGAAEFVKSSGWSYGEPPNPKKIAETIEACVSVGRSHPRDDLGIENVANEYFNFFTHIIDKKCSEK